MSGVLVLQINQLISLKAKSAFASIFHKKENHLSILRAMAKKWKSHLTKD